MLGAVSGSDPVPNVTTCSVCGAPWPPEGSPGGCPECGATSKTVYIEVADELNLADALETKATPGDQSQDWKGRWADLTRDVERLEAPRDSELSNDNILSAARELLSFYIRAYHLKDALRADSTSHGVTKNQIETAIDNDADLALLADLANLDKHLKLDRDPRSGDVPVIGPAHGIRAGSGEAGWRLEMEITHRGQVHDGLLVARASVEAWRRLLTSWGLA